MITTRRSRTAVLVCAGLTLSVGAALVAPLAAQRGGGPATVEFIATTADGALVTDLTAADLSLKVNNRDRAVSSLELIQFGASGSALPAPFGTNSLSGAGRSYVLIVDEESLRPGLENVVKDEITAFEQALPVSDRLGLFTIPRGTTSLAPTSDRESFRSAVAKIQGRMKASMTAAERRCHTRDTLAAMAGILGGAATTGGVTPVIFFSTGLVGASSGSGALGGPDDCAVQPSEFQRLGGAADASRAQLYLVRAEQNQDRTSSEGLENLVGVTGGDMLYLTGAEGGALARIVKETSAYYVATFTADAGERNGGSARVELVSARPGVAIRARTTVAIPRAGNTPTPESMLRELTVHRDFGLRVVGIPSRNDGDAKNDMKVFALAEPTDPAVKFGAAAMALYDPLGKLVSQWTARNEELQRSPLAAAIPVPTGQYRLRVAAVDTTGRAATADYELNVSTTAAGPAKLGGLMIGTAGANGFVPVISITNEPEVVAVFELYGRPEGPFGAIVEILDKTDSTTPLMNAPPQASATPVQDKFMFMATLPVASLKPGDYVLRVQLAFEGQPTGVLTRTVRKR
jgi:hypothetical protein